MSNSFDALLACLQSFAPPDDVEPWLMRANLVSAVHVPEAYRRAVGDLLSALGVLKSDDGSVTNAAAYHLLQSLIAAIREGAFSPTQWEGQPANGCTSFGADLTTLIEAHRLSCVSDPAPLRSVQAVLAVIKARQNGEDVYLMQYDPGARQFQPIGGKLEATDADNQAALVRELREELQLDHLMPGEHFRIQPILEHVRLTTLSRSLNILTRYEHSFYQLLGIRFPLHTDRETCWITADELARGKTESGRSISPLLHEHLGALLPSLPYSV